MCEGEQAPESTLFPYTTLFRSVHDTTYDPLVEEPLSGGPTILFECPAQIPRSSLRSFSLWATPILLSRLPSRTCAPDQRNFALGKPQGSSAVKRGREVQDSAWRVK